MMKHFYITSSCENGGVYHYKIQDENIELINKVTLDFPIYTIIRNKKAFVILKKVESFNGFGGLCSYDIDENGSFINKSEIVSSLGIVPCHLELFGSSIYLVNYLSGNIVKVPNKAVAHCGTGENPKRQDMPHTHFVSKTPDEKYLFCVDLGLDTIFTYDENLNEISKCKVPLGYGARHLAYSANGKYVYCVNELISSVTVFSYDNGHLTQLETYDALPNFKGENTAAAIRLVGDDLYISNRGANTISRFKIDGETLELQENTDCRGKGPRDFDITENILICTNENSDSVTFFKLCGSVPVFMDKKLDIKNPLCINFYK